MSQSLETPKNQTSKKVKAMLAGGLVLGVGAAVTLASWTDEESAFGMFRSGSFAIETSVDGTKFDDEAQEKEGAAQLQFDLSGANNMYPGQTVAAPFVMRLDKGTTYDAKVNLVSAAINDEPNAATHPNFDHLTYGIVQVDHADECVPEAKGYEIVSKGSKLDSTDDAKQFELRSGADGSAGEPVTLCFQVEAGDNLKQVAEPVEATWNFVGESVVSE